VRRTLPREMPFTSTRFGRASAALLLTLYACSSCSRLPPTATSAVDSPDGESAKDPSAPASVHADGATAGPAAPSDASAPLPHGTYRIVIERPTRVGAKYKRSVTVTDSRRETLVDGKTKLKNVDHRIQIKLVVEEEVLAVDALARWQKIKLTVETFSAAGAKGDEPVVPPGTVMTIERPATGNDATVTSSSGPLSKDARRALDLAIPSGAKSVSDDDIFGTKQPRAAGASWDIAREVAARDLATRGVRTSTAQIAGDTRILTAREDRGVPCLEMTARMSVKISGVDTMPAGSTIEQGEVTAEMTGIMPVDIRKMSHRSSSRSGMQLVAKIPVSKSMATLTVESLNVRETVYEEH